MRSPAAASSLAGMREPAQIALLVALAFGRTAHAAEVDDTCARAKAQLGSAVIERGMTAEQCQAALDVAEEERWQLWLDIAAADELAGDLERSALSLNKFLTAADRRERPLPAQWVVMRDEARLKIARADVEVLKTKGRVTIISTPEGAEATVIGGGATLADRAPKTPLTAYFEPGSHSVRLRVPATEATREVSFTVSVGSTIELRVDLRPDARPDTAVVENPGRPVLGQRPPTEGAPPQDVPGEEPVTMIEELGDDDDPEGPPVRDSGSSIAGSLGVVSLAAGGAALAMGVTFALVAAGLDDEARCGGAACDVDVGLRAHVRRDAEVAWDRATGTFVVGGLLVAGGVIALLLDDGDEAPTTSLAPWIGPSGAGLGGQVRF